VVHRVHDRYLLEIVEGLGLCPFARHCREQGRVHRPLLYDVPANPADAATRLHQVVTAHGDAEIVLLTFVSPCERSEWDRVRPFDEFVKQVRPHYVKMGGPTFFMVGFHPRSGQLDPGEQPPPLTPDSLVPQLRRTPDPVIQCVRAEVLERARFAAQQTAHTRLLAQELDPRLRALLEHSIQPDSTLSIDIAEHNYQAVAQDEGRAQLEATLAEIQRERDQAYAPWRDRV
jgi:hypothetical protein